MCQTTPATWLELASRKSAAVAPGTFHTSTPYSALGLLESSLPSLASFFTLTLGNMHLSPLPAEAGILQSEEELGPMKTHNTHFRHNWITPASSTPDTDQQAMKSFQHYIHEEETLNDSTLTNQKTSHHSWRQCYLQQSVSSAYYFQNLHTSLCP